mmetsp:Transcript_13438/g.58766  ORF Transcript_13438/g.58766 Transcript_13438/m.58766 type:complete len:269 (+) Transcript_13438:2726-3532(+)
MRHQRADRLVRPRQTPLAAPSPRARVRAPRRRREQPGGPRVLRRAVPTERRRSARRGRRDAPSLGVKCRRDGLAHRRVGPGRDRTRGRAADQGAESVERVPRGVPRAVSRAPRLGLARTAAARLFVGYLREERGDERVHLPRRELGAALLQQLRERFQRVLRGARVLLVGVFGGQRAEVVLGESRDKLSVQKEPLRGEKVPDERVQGAAAAGGRRSRAAHVRAIHRAREEEDVGGYLGRGGVPIGRGTQTGAVVQEGSDRRSERVAGG